MKTRANGEGRIYRPTYRDKAGELKHVETWWIQWTDTRRPKGKQQVRESSKSAKKADAVRLLRSRLEDLAKGRHSGPDIEKTTLGDLRAMIVNKFIEKKRRSMKRLRGALLHLMGDENRTGYFSQTEKANAITEDRISAYIAERVSEGAANGTINRELTTLRRMFRLGMRAKRLATVPAFDMLGEATARAGFFEPAEFNAVEARLPAEVKPVARVAYITGWRVASEILTRQWKHVDFGAGFLRLDPGETKNGKGRMFPFTPELRAALEEQRKRTTAIEQATGQLIPWTFHRNGQPIRAFRRSWAKACAGAGVPGRIPHDLRRTAVRNLERAGVPRSTAMALVGHETESIYRRYAINDETMLKEGIERLARLHEAQRGEYAEPKVVSIEVAR